MATRILPRRARLTKRTVDNLPTPATEEIVWDTEISGFGVRCLPTGVRTWILQRRLPSGRSVKLKIGRVSDLTADQARGEADRLNAEITLGRDPAATRRAVREQERERKTAPTVAELAAAWLADRRPGWRDRTAGEVERLLERNVLPALGARKVADVTYADVRKLHAALSRSPVLANRLVSWLRAMFSWAMHPERAADWRLSTNPAIGIAPNSEERRHRYPVGDELERLVTALHERGDLAAKFYLLLLLTGCRRGELENAKWSDFDLASATWTKPSTATKQRRLHRLPLSPEAVAILREVRAAATFMPFGRLDEWRLRVAWSEILAAARVDNLRVHDLRHWHASLLVSAGLGLPVIGALLGHSSQATTARYAHLLDEVQREAAERIGQLIKLPARPR